MAIGLEGRQHPVVYIRAARLEQLQDAGRDARECLDAAVVPIAFEHLEVVIVQHAQHGLEDLAVGSGGT